MNKMVNSIQKKALFTIAILFGEFIVGIYTTLFIHFPNTTEDKLLWNFTEHNMILVIHILLGMVTFFGSLSLLFQSVKIASRVYFRSSVLAFMGILLAMVSGMLFIPTQNDMYSFVMAFGFVIANIGLLLVVMQKSTT